MVIQNNPTIFVDIQNKWLMANGESKMCFKLTRMHHNTKTKFSGSKLWRDIIFGCILAPTRTTEIETDHCGFRIMNC